MTRDRVVQLLALLIAVVSLGGAAALVPVIDQQRRDLDLTYEYQGGRGIPPRYALATAALGSFRGLAVDILWYRAEHLKREGKLFEANDLAEFITTLQPRFPQVWSFHAWNMAYNISVMTHTPEERWSWVDKGVRLLRDEGIVYNPKAVRLYRELGWIFFHKIGQFTDDMHWYYKLKVAEQWQELLGAMTEGATEAQTLAEFEPIMRATELYFGFDKPSKATRDALEVLAEGEADARLSEELRGLKEQSLLRFVERTPAFQARLQAEHRFKLAESLAPLLARERDRLSRAARDPLTLFYEASPQVVPLVEQLREMGLELNGPALRRIGRLQMYLRYASPQFLLSPNATFLDATDRRLIRMLLDPETLVRFEALLPYLRAKVLLQEYHMDPRYMYEMMQMFGPLDWRHPASHGLYWSALGVQVAGEMRDSTKYDVLNTDRQVVHSLQNLMFYGRVNYDPFAGQVDLLPDARFIDKYAQAMDAALARAKTGTFSGSGTNDSFESGHENFLIKAVVLSYVYGDEAQARGYYDKVRRLYAHKDHNQRSGRYNQPLAQFVTEQYLQDMGMMQVSRPFVAAMLTRGFTQGLAMSRFDVFNHFVEIAQQAHRSYNAERDYATPEAPGQGRLSLLPFEQIVVETYVDFMRSPNVDLYRRARVYVNSPPALVEMAFARFREPLYAQAQQAGYDPAQMFPAPPGLDERQLQPGDMTESLPQTIERQ